MLDWLIPGGGWAAAIIAVLVAGGAMVRRLITAGRDMQRVEQLEADRKADRRREDARQRSPRSVDDLRERIDRGGRL